MATLRKIERSRAHDGIYEIEFRRSDNKCGVNGAYAIFGQQYNDEPLRSWLLDRNGNAFQGWGGSTTIEEMRRNAHSFLDCGGNKP